MSVTVGARSVVNAVVRSSDGHVSAATVHDSTAGGEPNGEEAVILLHGLSQQRRFWDPVVARMRHRPIISVDQRGHGASTADPSDDFSIDRCARDIIELSAELGFARVHVVGHSWGGAVALRLAAAAPGLVASACLIDGGLSTPSAPSETDPARRADLLSRLRPPALGIPIDEIWQMIGAGMGGSLTGEVRDALAPTYVIGPEGLARTVIGIDRHMAVLEGLLDYDPWPDAESLCVPLWAVFCEPRQAQADEVRLRAIERTEQLPTALVQRWNGAWHDVPLQWPALVAGLIDSCVESSTSDLVRST
jgi:pimeloyl-ACP methyl ester carboxylesterase